MKTVDFTISVTETLRYAGHRDSTPPESIAAAAKKAADICRGYVTPRYIVSRFEVTQAENGVAVGDTGLVLLGQDIKKHLADCNECYIICATAGAGADGFIRSSMAESTLQGLMADAAATAAVESICDSVEKNLRNELKKEGKYLTWRYSPGYGDFPFTQQPDILSLLQADRFTGVTCNDSCIMTPSKSVTAVMGIANRKPQGRLSRCNTCPNKENCNFSCR